MIMRKERANQRKCYALTSDAKSLETFRVMHVLPSLGAGGADRAAVTLVRDLASLNVDARLAVLGPREPKLPGGFYDVPMLNYIPPGARFKEGNSFLRLIGLLKRVNWLRRQLKLFGAQIVHSHLWPAARIASLASRGLGILHVVHCHGQEPWLANSPRRRFYARFLFQGKNTTYIAVSEAVRRYVSVSLPWIPRDRLRIVHNGADLTSFPLQDRAQPRCDLESSQITVGSAGRFIPRKGHCHLLHAVAKLQKEGISIKLIIAGDGPLRSEYYAMCDALKISDTVEFPGVLEDMAQFYSSLDIFVFPSTHDEGLPLAVLEAMALGLPVVATDVAGTAEVINSGAEGFIVPPFDAEAIVAAIRRLAQNLELRCAIGQAAKEKIRRHFTSRITAAKVREIYKQELYRV